MKILKNKNTKNSEKLPSRIKMSKIFLANAKNRIVWSNIVFVLKMERGAAKNVYVYLAEIWRMGQSKRKSSRNLNKWLAIAREASAQKNIANASQQEKDVGIAANAYNARIE